MASFDASPPPIPLSRDQSRIFVFKKLETEDGEPNGYRLLPNIHFIDCAEEQGASPGSARFLYVFDPIYLEPDDPRGPEDCFPFDAAGPHVVEADDRIVVRLYHEGSDRKWTVLFDGFAKVPQMDHGSGSSVTFEAMATPSRLWDTPIVGAYVRQCNEPEEEETIGPWSGVKVRFNPLGKPNCTSGLHDVNHGEENAYPVFLTELLKQDPDPRRHWTLGGAVRYLLFTMNEEEKYVKNPKASVIDTILEAWEPAEDDMGVIDPDDPSTYLPNPINVPDLDVTGDTLAVALAKVVEPHGFAFRFRLETDENGDPEWSIVFYRMDDPTPAKRIYIQATPPGEVVTYDPAKTNVGSINLARDGEIVNEFQVTTEPVYHEVSIIIPPLFKIEAADASEGSADRWVKGDPNFDPIKYRVFGYSEDGIGFWNFRDSALDTEPGDLSEVFGEADEDGPKYWNRPRPGRHELISKDKFGAALPAEVWVSTDYKTVSDVITEPVLWDKSIEAHWQKVANNEWELLKDRLGIRITSKDPQSWHIGQSTDETAPFPQGVVNVVTSLATPSDTDPRFTVRLVVAIPSDVCLDAKAERRISSPTNFKVRRLEDTNDRFIKEVIHKSSPYNKGSTDVVKRDDTKAAKAHVEAKRKAHELLSIQGEITIPYVTTSYEVGDRIVRIEGKNMSLRQNAGAAAGEGPVYPAVVGRRFMAHPRQQTVLIVNDRRADPAPERRR